LVKGRLAYDFLFRILNMLDLDLEIDFGQCIQIKMSSLFWCINSTKNTQFE